MFTLSNNQINIAANMVKQSNVKSCVRTEDGFHFTTKDCHAVKISINSNGFDIRFDTLNDGGRLGIEFIGSEDQALDEFIKYILKLVKNGINSDNVLNMVPRDAMRIHTVNSRGIILTDTLEKCIITVVGPNYNRVRHLLEGIEYKVTESNTVEICHGNRNKFLSNSGFKLMKMMGL